VKEEYGTHFICSRGQGPSGDGFNLVPLMFIRVGIEMLERMFSPSVVSSVHIFLTCYSLLLYQADIYRLDQLTE